MAMIFKILLNFKNLNAKFIPRVFVKLGPHRFNIQTDSNSFAGPKRQNLPARNHPQLKNVSRFFVVISVDSKVQKSLLIKTQVPEIVIGILKGKLRGLAMKG
jgi:hypothetical protein